MTFSEKREKVKKIKLYNWVCGIFFLPGFFLHELSHYIPAYIFFRKGNPKMIFKFNSRKLSACVKFITPIKYSKRNEFITIGLISIAPLFMFILLMYVFLTFITLIPSVALIMYILINIILSIPSKSDMIIFSNCIAGIIKKN